jgi:hypothetical protein
MPGPERWTFAIAKSGGPESAMKLLFRPAGFAVLSLFALSGRIAADWESLCT